MFEVVLSLKRYLTRLIGSEVLPPLSEPFHESHPSQTAEGLDYIVGKPLATAFSVLPVVDYFGIHLFTLSLGLGSGFLSLLSGRVHLLPPSKRAFFLWVWVIYQSPVDVEFERVGSHYND